MSQNDDLHRLRVAMFGIKADESDGVMARVQSHAITLYGTEENPGGISKDVRTMKRWVGIASAVVSVCAGLLVIIEFFSKVAPIFKGMK